MVLDLAVGIRVLDQHAEAVVLQRIGQRADVQLDLQRPGAGLEQFQGLRVHRIVHEEGVGLVACRTLGQGHRLGRGGGFIQQRGVGDFHAAQLGDHGLEVDQRFHPALGDFRLVRGVGGVPGRVFQDVARDHVRRVGAVIALADEAAEHLVLAGDGADAGQCVDFGHRTRQFQRIGGLDAGRHDGIGERFQRGLADNAEHLLDFAFIRADVALDEGAGVFKGVQRRGVLGHGLRVQATSRAWERKDRPIHAQAHGRKAWLSAVAPLSFCLRVWTRMCAWCPFGAGLYRSLQSCAASGIGPERLRALRLRQRMDPASPTVLRGQL